MVNVLRTKLAVLNEPMGEPLGFEALWTPWYPPPLLMGSWSCWAPRLEPRIMRNCSLTSEEQPVFGEGQLGIQNQKSESLTPEKQPKKMWSIYAMTVPSNDWRLANDCIGLSMQLNFNCSSQDGTDDGLHNSYSIFISLVVGWLAGWFYDVSANVGLFHAEVNLTIMISSFTQHDNVSSIILEYADCLLYRKIRTRPKKGGSWI